MTSTLATQTDTALAAIYERENKIRSYRESAIKSLAFALGYRGSTPRPPLASLLTAAKDGGPRIQEALAQLAKADAQVTAIVNERMPLDAIYETHRWSRFFLVTNSNGHIHSSLRCQTCQHDTSFAWLPTLSGQTEAEAVEEWGGILCSVCFPSAPVEHTLGVNKKTAAEKAARQADLDVKRAAKAAKAITMPDGSPLRSQWGIIATLVSAQRELVDALMQIKVWDGMATAHGTHPNYGTVVPEYRATADRIIEAIAAKTGETTETIQAEADAKAEKKYRRDYA